MTWSHGSFHWNELMTHDAEQAKRFYADAVGWSFDAMPMDHGTYWLAMAGGKPVAGIFTMQGPDFAGMPDNWVPYLAVDDVDARLAKAVAAGASVCHPAFDIAGVGRIAVLREPGGAMVGWMTPTT